MAGEKLSSVSVKEDYTVYLDAYGYMIYVEENEEIGNYALVLDTANKGDFVGKKAELLFTDGTTKVVTTEKDYSTGTNEIKDNRIVTYKVDADGVYTLREVDTKKASYTDLDAALDMKNDRASITITADNTNGKLNKSTVTANSATVFVVRDTVDTDDYTAYTGIKNAPTIKTTGATDDAKKAGVYLYCKSDNSKMVTVMFIIPGAKVDVSDESSDALYLSNKSISNLIHDSDDDYYEFNAIVNGEIKTVKVADDAKILDKDGNITSTKAVKADGLYKSYATNKYGVITTLREFTPYSDGITKQYFVGEGIDKVSKEYTVILNTAGKYSMPKNETITVDDKADIYYVDKDGNISTSSYKSIAVDDNDQVYAIVKDYLVKTLVIFEVKDPDTSKPVVKTDGTMSITADVSAMEIAYVSGKIDGTVIDGWKTAKATAVVKATVNGDTYTETTKVTTDTKIKDIVDALKLPAEISSIGTGYKVNVTVNLTFEGLDGTTYTVAGSTVVYS